MKINSFFVPNVNSNKICTNYNMNALNYIYVKCGVNELKFLLDTGASISCIFADYVESCQIDTSSKIKIKGVTGSTFSLGTASISFYIKNEKFKHNFCVVDKFDSSIHGVLGSDFFIKTGAVINYEEFVISFYSENREITTALQSSSDEYTIIPPRCEVIKYCYTESADECVILNEELCEGVIVASIIVKPEKNFIPVKILNVNEREVRLKNFQPKTESSSVFRICSFRDEGISVNRVEKVLELINAKSINREEKTSIEKICAKYADVFQLEGDPLTATNLYR